MGCIFLVIIDKKEKLCYNLYSMIKWRDMGLIYFSLNSCEKQMYNRSKYGHTMYVFILKNIVKEGNYND